MNKLKLYIKILYLSIKIKELEKIVDTASEIIAHDLPTLIVDGENIRPTKEEVKKWLISKSNC